MDTSKTEVDIPKVIWVLWLQGFENAPKIVKKCVDTWERANESWKVVKLDEERLEEYIDIEKILKVNGKNIEKSDISNAIRIKLLSKYGGVWVDSTCICQRPLDTWLHEYTSSGFFAFSEPTKDREIASWFLASEKNNYLTNALCKNYVTYFRENEFSRQNTDFGRFVRMKLEGALNISRKTPMIWFSYAVKNLMKVYPYFAFHYKFSETCRKNEKACSVWENTPKYSADDPLRPIRIGLTDTACSDLEEGVLNEKVPMYKLTWRVKSEAVKEDTLLACILTKNKYLNMG